MSDKPGLVGELMEYVEDKITKQILLPSLTLDTQPLFPGEAGRTLRAIWSGTHPVVAAQDQARDAIRRWIEAVRQDVNPKQEP